MKFLRSFLFFTLFTVWSCQKEAKNWNVELPQPLPEVKITDISASFYNPRIPLAQFQRQYPWFQGSVPDEDYLKRRSDSTEINLYKKAHSLINEPQLKKELAQLFAHIQYYFPKFSPPQVFLYSSALQGVESPVFYRERENWLFIDITAFMGDGNPYYKNIDLYLQHSMNPQNLIPKVSKTLAEQIVPWDRKHRKFIDMMVYEGKLMILQDAFLPQTSDALKIGYTPQQEQWALQNEENIWNYFVENDLLFSDDSRLVERFILPAPFSKFYTEIDRSSAPMAGIFSGWQMCRTYFKQHPETPLAKFISQTDAETILNTTRYQGKP